MALTRWVDLTVYQSEGQCFNRGSTRLHVKVSLGKKLNPKLLPMTVPLVYECVCLSSLWAGCKRTLSSWKTRKTLYKYSPFTIYLCQNLAPPLSTIQLHLQQWCVTLWCVMLAAANVACSRDEQQLQRSALTPTDLLFQLFTAVSECVCCVFATYLGPFLA